MRIKKAMQRLAAWGLTACLIISAGSNLRAEEQASETETLSWECQETETITAETITTETITTETEVPETEIPETEEETLPTKETEAETETETEKVIVKKITRAEEQNRSSEFQIDELVVKYGNTVIYEEKDGNQINTPQKPPSNTGTDTTFYVNFAWSQKESKTSNFKKDDYIEFEIISFTGGNADTTWDQFTSQKLLIDPVTKDILGTGIFNVVSEEGKVKLVYRVTFTDKIENQHEISGTMESKAHIEKLKEDEWVQIIRKTEEIFKLTKKSPPPTGGFHGVTSPTDFAETGKKAMGYDPDKNNVTWQIQWREFIANRYMDYEDNYKTNKYDYIIIDEQLDPNLTFRGKESHWYAGVNMTILAPMYLYDPAGLLGNSDTKGTSYAPPFTNLAYKASTAFTYIPPASGSEADAAAAITSVKETALSWTLVDEPDPADQTKTRERLVLNLGAPGNGGLRFNDTGIGPYLVNLANDIAEVEAVVQKAADEGIADTEKVTDSAGRNNQTVSRWKNILTVYKDTLAYYETNPYIYGYNCNIRTILDPLDPETATAEYVTNSCTLSSGNTVITASSSVDNQWAGTIRATANAGEVQILKADSLGGFKEGILNEIKTLGNAAVPNVEFQVFEKDGTTALKFTLKNGKYNYDEISGSELIMTDNYGSIIIAGLTHGKEYTVRETKSASGYYTEKKEITFKVNNSKAVYGLINNTPRVAELLKVDKEDHDKVLAGAVFELYKADDSKLTGFAVKNIGGVNYLVYTGNAADTAALKTDSDGKLKILKLPAGDYYFKETIAPDQYVLPDEKNNKFAFELPKIQEENAIVNVLAENGKEEEPGKEPAYTASGKITLTAEKKWADDVGINLKDRQFAFEVLEGKTVAAAGSNRTDGSITFTDISYQVNETVDDTGEHTYQIREVKGNDQTVIYDETVFNVKVQVSDNKDGTLKAEIVSINGKDPASEKVVFTNHLRQPSGFLEEEASVVIKKNVLAGKTAAAVTDTFYFTLYTDKEMSNIVETRSLTLKNVPDGQVIFEKLPYGTYYIAESNEAGIPVNADFKYAVSASKTTVTLTDTDKTATIWITNNLGDEEETESEYEESDKPKKPKKQDKKVTTINRTTTTRTSSAKTGDQTDIAVFILLLAAAGLVLSGAAYIRKLRK